MRQLKIDHKITSRTKLTDLYFTDVNQYDTISADSEIELANRIKSGDECALNILVTSNLRFVISVAKQYSGNDPDLLLDLISQGNIGLIDSAKTYDSTRGFKFISYAVWHIRKEILQYLLNNKRTIRIPQNVNQAINRANKVIQKFEQEHERAIESDELKELLLDSEEKEYSTIDFDKAYMHFKGTFSLDTPTNEDGGTMHDILESGEFRPTLLREDSLSRLIQIIEGCLNPVESNIIKYRFGLDGGDLMHWNEVGKLVNKSPEMSRVICKKAIRIVQRFAKNNNISLADFEL